MSDKTHADLFEEVFQELLVRRLRDDLSYNIVECRRQSPGAQYGKDIQARWIADGRESGVPQLV